MKSFKLLAPIALAYVSMMICFAGCTPEPEPPVEPVVETVTDKVFDGWGTFTGTLVDSRPSGEGKLIAEGFTYEGTFEDGFKVTGEGVLTRGKEIFKGTFVNGNLNGYGEVDYGNGCHGIGEWKEGKIHGKSFFIWPQGEGAFDWYFGDWEGQVREDDEGYYQFNNGCYYVGEFHDWINGQGTFHWVGGNYWTGTFEGGSPKKGTYGYGKMDGTEGYIAVNAETGAWSWYNGTLEDGTVIENGQPKA